VATILIYLSDAKSDVVKEEERGGGGGEVEESGGGEGVGRVRREGSEGVRAENNGQCKGGATNFPIAQLPASAIDAFNSDPTSGISYHGRRTREKFFDDQTASKKEKLG
jgi:hypothetical protein